MESVYTGRMALADDVRRIEQALFADQLDPGDRTRMRNDGKYSWLYRPSHHVESGLVTEADITMLSQPGKRLLSVGAHPLSLERVLLELGIPAQNIVTADHDPGIKKIDCPVEKLIFDMTHEWPELGDFDLIIFPESLCIAIRDTIKQEGAVATHEQFATDAREAALLAHVLGEALQRLKPGGEIRANGPMSHPNVVKKAGALLDAKKRKHSIAYARFFLRVTH